MPSKFMALVWDPVQVRGRDPAALARWEPLAVTTDDVATDATPCPVTRRGALEYLVGALRERASHRGARLVA
jgi:hypothetical protein